MSAGSLSSHLEQLREHLEKRDLSAFLNEYAAQISAGRADTSPAMLGLKQRMLPAILREKLQSGAVEDQDVVLVWRLVSAGHLILVDSDLREAINRRIGSAWQAVHPQQECPAPLPGFGLPSASIRRQAILPITDLAGVPAIALRRIVLAATFEVAAANLTDSESFAKNLCASRQEREFMRAVAQFFPRFLAYPNVPLSNFIDLDGAVARLPERYRSFARLSKIDVLVVTPDQDPVACFELDSRLHDNEDASDRDRMKDAILAAASIPLFRIRPERPTAVTAGEFFDLLQLHAEALDRLRPRRMRDRREHEALVPATLYAH